MSAAVNSALPPIVYVVDDDPSVGQALARLLASEGLRVSLHPSARDFLTACDAVQAGCIVLDLAMPDMTGMQLQAQLQAHGVHCPVVFLTGCGDIASSVRAMKAGAVDFLTKPVDADALLSAVRQGLALDAAAQRAAQERRHAEALLATLTPREREVLPHLVTGRLNKQMAADLGVAEKTIKVHRARVLHKLGVRTPVELLGFLQRAGLAPRP